MADVKLVVKAFLVALALLGGGAFPASSFDGERLAFPANGDVVPAEVKFYIEATGKPAPEEYYRIEIATDSKFNEIVATFDQRKRPNGWIKATQFDIKDIPAEIQPRSYDGIHFRAPHKFADGVYYWRAYKAQGAGEFDLLSGAKSFTVDTQAPAAVKDLRLERERDGVRLLWSFVAFDVNGQPEQVAGYRVYHFEKLLKRFPMMTRYLEAETQDNQAFIPAAKEKEPRITFYLVQAVDMVGNEIGRKRPTRMGEFEAAFNPPDLDALANVDNLRRMNREAKKSK